VMPMVNDQIAPLKIAAYDIECISSDENFPQAKREGDRIIQIGMTVYRYGSLECEDRYLLSLKKTSEIENTNVQCFKTEKDLLLAFVELIHTVSPDCLSGYNVFGFDDNYIYERSKVLKIKEKMFLLGKLYNPELREMSTFAVTPPMAATNAAGKTVGPQTLAFKKLSRFYDGTYIEFPLSSSALGDNLLKLYDTPGIIRFDMMKVIQRDHKLESYKLDSVSAVFIREKIEKFSKSSKTTNQGKIQIISESVKGLNKNSFIQIVFDDGFAPSPLREGSKYEVLNILQTEDNYTIHIDMPDDEYAELETLNENKSLSFYWTFAKDDIHHSEIFKSIDGTADDRARIGKYCVKDCELVNILLAKLDIITGNIGMANVCHVPLKYIFMRGQGIKIFSLVSKKCRQKHYLIPTLTRTSDDEDEEDEGYEGAMVITPVPMVYLSPISILDFASLYPNSMRERNLSHECIVMDEKYDNLPDYNYYNVEYKNNDGSTTRCRYAQHKDGTYGIVPEILTDLLNSRTDMKNKVETAPNAFMKNIYDSLQLAYKVTANSLYGQIGAKTSPIFYLEIAASTTAIGRERLAFARDVVVQVFPGAEVIYGDSVTGDTPLLLLNSNDKIHLTDFASFIEENKWFAYNEFKLFDRTLTSKQQAQTDMRVWTRTGWSKIKRIIRHKTNKRIYRVSTPSGIVDVTEDHSLLDIDGKIIKPIDCITSMELLHSFPIVKSVFECKVASHAGVTEVMNESIFTKEEFINSLETTHTIKLSNKLQAQGIYYLLKSLGYDICIKSQSDHYELTYGHNLIIANRYAVQKVEYLYTVKNQYVYDLETEDGSFAAGIGELVVKNTDSIFINFNILDDTGKLRSDKGALKESIDKAEQCEREINSRLPKPQNIVYEKTFLPLILVAKKKYVGNMYKTDINKFKQKSMGIVLKRRDNPPIVKIVVGGIIDNILNKQSVDEAVEYIRGTLSNLFQGNYKIDKFIMSKTLKAKYNDPTRNAHKVLADRVALRDPGNKFQINDRVPYVYVTQKPTKRKDVLQGEIIETPDFVQKNHLPIDYLFYLENQIMNPSVQILELLIKKPEKIFDEYISKEVSKRLGRQDISKFISLDGDGDGDRKAGKTKMPDDESNMIDFD
jgi:DNA polymerase elongation subunit (family B)